MKKLACINCKKINSCHYVKSAKKLGKQHLLYKEKECSEGIIKK